MTASGNSADRSADWTQEPLRDLGTWVGGGTPSKRNPDYWNEGTVPWVSPKDIKEHVLTRTEDKITEAAIQGSAARKFEANSIAIVVRSGILEHSLPIALVPFSAAANQDMRVLTPRPGLNPRWLLYALRGHADQIRRTCSKQGTTVASIEVPRMMDYRIAVPPVGQQDAVAEWAEESLGEVSAGLEALRSAQSRGEQLSKAILLRTAFGGPFRGEFGRTRENSVTSETAGDRRE
ncbi:MAG TPA: restriction endonuclease subunit S [Solirubrobacterales bacterium]|nr:restriction endonuclease subunit S [Solirubrobacterales bacterium]